MFSSTIRRKFLHYFKDRGHALVSSSPVVPHDDPTLLFTNAGMNQFKDLFLGKSSRDYTQAATSQKCIRAGGKHNDLENVGHTSRHLTFFEMLGNFSFGNYFKKEAIAFAWEVALDVFELDPKFIYATVLLDDEESFLLWKSYLPEERIIRMGEKDNFWAMGDTGPCGPSSELLYDRGPKFGTARNPVEDTSGERFFEFWNLVFMEFNRKNDGILESLPKRSVDTGAGLERVVSLKMGVNSLFETDILRELIAEVEKVFHATYDPEDPKNYPAFRVIADHLRSLSFAIADGAQPSNIERGYVLRKILRRAVRYGRMLGAETPFLGKILPRLIGTMGSDYPELKASMARIEEILTKEEESFFRTLKRGGNMLNSIISDAIKHGRTISGKDAFTLKDTYGLPIEEIELIAKDSNLILDMADYEKLELEAKERSRKAHKTQETSYSEELFSKTPPTQFLGYETKEHVATITSILKEGAFVQELAQGEEGTLLLDATPFYAEKGGQVGDRGQIQGESLQFEVEDCLTPFPGVIQHVGKVLRGKAVTGQKVNAVVDANLRQKIANNHTATHLLHFALQKVLGEHIKQAGSLVEATRLRFDFNHHKSLTKQELTAIEDLVSEMIRANLPVETYELTLEEATAKKEIKQFFGEKYGKKVRVVELGPSKELCGGTHTRATGNIGTFKIVRESSIASGIRRIEAVTGAEAIALSRVADETLEKVATLLKAQSASVTEKIEGLLDENKELQASLSTLKKELLSFEVEKLLGSKQVLGGVCFLIRDLKMDPKDLKNLADLVSAKVPSLALAFFVGDEEKCSFLFKVSADLVSKGIHADEWMKACAQLLGGKGGGRKDFAQGGGNLPKNIPEALKKAREWIEEYSKKSS